MSYIFRIRSQKENEFRESLQDFISSCDNSNKTLNWNYIEENPDWKGDWISKLQKKFSAKSLFLLLLLMVWFPFFYKT